MIEKLEIIKMEEITKKELTELVIDKRANIISNWKSYIEV